MPQIELPALEAVVTLNPCQAPAPDPVVTTLAPVRAHKTLYLAAGDCLYAVNAADGTAHWCQQVRLTRTREVRYPPTVSVPPPPRARFATPRVVDGIKDGRGVVYVVCEYGFGSHTCAFTAGDGSLLWWTPTDARVSGGHYLDWAIPLLRDGIVYSGTYALSEQDGSVLWRSRIDTNGEGALALHALTEDTLYATTQMGIYAINAQDGQIRWHYQPDAQSMVSGPPVVVDDLLYAGTTGSIGHPEKCHVFALDGATGAEVWRYPMDHYIGAVADHARLYVSSGDRTLYAWDRQSGMPRWHHTFAAPGQFPATSANDVLYITTDGLYALNSEDGAVLWHQNLGSSASVSFGPLVVLDGAVYVVRGDRHPRGELYALNMRTGAEHWHTPYPTFLTLAQ